MKTEHKRAKEIPLASNGRKNMRDSEIKPFQMKLASEVDVRRSDLVVYQITYQSCDLRFQ